MEISGKGVLITGASRGLGLALASEAAERGAKVALVARGHEELERAARSIRARGGVAHAIVADVGDKLAIHPLVAQAHALLGSVDVLVHNASTLGPVPLALLADTECEDFARALEVNVLGPFRLTKAVVSAMALRGSGAIVHVSSDAAVEAYARWGAYAVSKAALDHLARSWAAELDGTGVHVWSVDPGEMDTEMHAVAMPEADRASLTKPELVARRIVQQLARASELHGTRIKVSQEEVRS